MADDPDDPTDQKDWFNITLMEFTMRIASPQNNSLGDLSQIGSKPLGSPTPKKDPELLAENTSLKGEIDRLRDEKKDLEERLIAERKDSDELRISLKESEANEARAICKIKECHTVSKEVMKGCNSQNNLRTLIEKQLSNAALLQKEYKTVEDAGVRDVIRKTIRGFAHQKFVVNRKEEESASYDRETLVSFVNAVKRDVQKKTSAEWTETEWSIAVYAILSKKFDKMIDTYLRHNVSLDQHLLHKFVRIGQFKYEELEKLINVGSRNFYSSRQWKELICDTYKTVYPTKDGKD